MSITTTRSSKEYLEHEAAFLRKREADSRTISHQLTAKDRLYDAKYHAGKAEGYRESAERLEKLAALITPERNG
jgi:hypothetical protein